MKFSIQNGQLTIGFGNSLVGRNGQGSGHQDDFRIQLYWPYIRIRNRKKEEVGRAYKEFYATAPTNIRLVLEKGYWGAGGNILGFGLAADYQKQNLLEG